MSAVDAGPPPPAATARDPHLDVCVHRRPAAIALCERLAGWRVYVTNTPAPRLSVAGAVNCYRQQWQPEHGFQRLKGGLLAITPLFFRDENRIRGLLVLLGVALRVLTLSEFVARRDSAAGAKNLPGSTPATPSRHLPAHGGTVIESLCPHHPLPSRNGYHSLVRSHTPLPCATPHPEAFAVPESVYAPPAAPLIDSG